MRWKPCAPHSWAAPAWPRLGDRSRSFFSSRWCSCRCRWLPSPGRFAAQKSTARSLTGKRKAGPAKRNRPECADNLCLGLLLSHVDLEVDSRRHLLQLFQACLGLRGVGSIGVQFDGFLVGLDGSGRELRHLLISYFLDRHSVNQRSAKQIPGLRVFGIQLRGLLQGFHGIAQSVRVVQADAEVSPRRRRIEWIEFRTLGISSFGFIDFSRARQHVSKIVVVAWHVRFGVDRLLISLHGFVVASSRVVGFSELGPQKVQIRILFDGGFLRCLIFLCRLIGQVRQLLLGGIALIRSCLLQFCFRSLLLLENRVSRGKVRLHSLKLGLGLFLLLHLLLYSSALLGHDLLEVCVRLGVFSTPYSDLSHGVRRLLVIRRGKRCDREDRKSTR